MRRFPTSPRSAIPATVLVLLVATSGTLGAQDQRDEGLRVSDALGVSEFTSRSQLDLSLDGERVAFTLKDPYREAESGPRGAYFDDRGVPRGHRGTDVYVADATSGTTRRLSNGRGSSWSPAWSPDGRYLAFYSDRDGAARLWLWDPAEDTIVRLSDGIVRPYWGFERIEWSPDGRRVLVKLLPEGMSSADVERLLPTDAAARREPPTEQTGVTARTFAYVPGPPPADEESPRAATPVDIDATRSFLNVQLADLAVIDVPSGRTHRIAHRVRAIGYRFAPAGDRVAFSTRQPDAGTGTLVYDRYDLWVVDAAGGPVRPLAPLTVQEYGLGFSWAPDGESIAYMSDGAVHVIRAEDGAAVHSFERDGVTLRHHYRPPLWLDEHTMMVAARDTLWRLSLATEAVTPLATPRARQLREIVAPAGAQQLNGSRVTVTVSDPGTKRVGFQRLDVESGTLTPLYEADLALGSTVLAYHLDVSHDGGTIAFVAESGSQPPDVWIADAGFTRARRVTDLHPEFSRLPSGSSRLVEWTDSSGRQLQGALLLPAGYEPGERYPLVVKVYGGSLLSGRVNRFGLESGVDNLQLLATRGYAVLVPDTPLGEGTPLADLASAVLPGVDAVIAMGVADPERLALFGHSYGGYSVLAIAVQSSRFRAVISSAGFGNLFGKYTLLREDGSAVGIGWSERGQGRMGGHPWEHFDRYRENSPFFFLDNITAPVLLLHGGSDGTVLPQRAEETFVALRRLDKEVTLAVYEGEGHHPGTWSIENATDYWERIFSWLTRHLTPTDTKARP